MTAPRTESRLLPALLVAGATALAFLPALRGEFLNWDDDENFLLNPNYRGLGWAQLSWMFTTTHMGPYAPLAWVTLGLDHLLWGMDPRGYHATSIALHALDAALFFAVARRLLVAGLVPGAPGGDAGANPERAASRGALLAALAWALHPLRVESVAWITERRDLVMGLFLLLATLAYLSAWERGRDGRLHPGWHGAAVGCFALALLAKAVVVGLPLVLLLLDIFPLRRLRAPGRPGGLSLLRLGVEKIPFLGVAVAVSAVAVGATGERGLLTSLEALGPGARLVLSGYSLAFYLWKTLVPWPLSPLYPLSLPMDPWSPGYLLPALAALALTAGVLAMARRWPLWLVVWGAHLLLLLPVAGLLHNRPQAAADRYTYAPGLAWGGLAGAGLVWLERAREARTLPAAARTLVPGVAMALLMALAGLSLLQVGIWRDSVALWRHVAWAEPDSDIPVFYLGWALREAGRLDEAREHFARSLDRVQPRLGELRARLLTEVGIVEQRARRHAAAAQRFREALGLAPGHAPAVVRLGSALMAQGDPAEGERVLAAAPPIVAASRAPLWELRAAIAEATAGDRETRGRLAFALGLGLQRRGALEEAGEQYREAAALLPRPAEAWNNLGVTRALRGRDAEALEAFRQALRAEPGHPGACANALRAAERLGTAPPELAGCSAGTG